MLLKEARVHSKMQILMLSPRQTPYLPRSSFNRVLSVCTSFQLCFNPKSSSCLGAVSPISQATLTIQSVMYEGSCNPTASFALKEKHQLMIKGNLLVVCVCVCGPGHYRTV